MIQSEDRMRKLIDENIMLREKIKTVSYENQQLAIQKNEVFKRMNEMPMLSTEQFMDNQQYSISQQQQNRLTLASNNNNNNHVLSTPKHRFMDDSAVKYHQDPHARGNELFGEQFSSLQHDHDFSRRFSIDSFATGRNSTSNNNQTGVMPSFNRFNAISENEFEEPDFNQKSLHHATSLSALNTHQENQENAARRISTLQIRNQQTKPHLKSSYPLEMMTQDVHEDVIRKGASESKDNNSILRDRTSMINQSGYVNKPPSNLNQKRRMEDAAESKSPKKSATVVKYNNSHNNYVLKTFSKKFD